MLPRPVAGFALLVGCALAVGCGRPVSEDASESSVAKLSGPTFTNPLFRGQDPFVTFEPSLATYYYASAGCGGGNTLCLRASRTLTGLAQAPSVAVFRGPSTGDHSAEYWAPTLQHLRGVWYLYYAADDGSNAHHRIFVASNPSADPMQGTFRDEGQLHESFGQWAIDPAVLEAPDGRLYLFWSNSASQGGAPQRIALAPMSDPLHVSGPSALISSPFNDWEQEVAAINEQPRPFVRNGRIYVPYNASASWTNNYQVGLLTPTGSDLTCGYGCWHKVGPILSYEQNWANGVYGPGGFSVVPSPDGTEDWVMYHAAVSNGAGWTRDVRLQRLFWDGELPNPGYPAAAGTLLEAPSGEGGYHRPPPPASFGWGNASLTDASGGGTRQGNWTLSSESAVTSNTLGGAAWERLFRGNPNFRHFQVEADVTWLEQGSPVPGDVPKYGLFPCFQGPGNAVLAALDKNNNVLAAGVQTGGGAWHWRNSAPLPKPWRNTHHLKVIKYPWATHGSSHGSTLELYVTDWQSAPVLTLTDVPFLSCQVGTMTENTRAGFSHFQVQNLDN